ncbi:uncharacterized protein LOC127641781 [Xyrauchen texanus]|uniref:uncharacterized protein LOC127641781 n=1 Tax=Xyrauchen texanus TaxID=154827 RepID=UPI002241B001|nr:uncharacterized protein LOC127641781 [Xyrauchen texanus]
MHSVNAANTAGVIFDSKLNFGKQINAVVRSSFFQLRQIAKLKPLLSFKDLETFIHAFISSRLDYSNALYMGLNHSSLYRLQLVQNAAARLLTGAKKREHISPVLASLHGLPVHYRIHFKIFLFVYKDLNGVAPSYLSELLSYQQTPRSLRSSDKFLLQIPRSRLNFKVDRAFSVAGPRLWNSIPLDVRSAPSIPVFKSRLKTYLYSLAFTLMFIEDYMVLKAHHTERTITRVMLLCILHNTLNKYLTKQLLL